MESASLRTLVAKKSDPDPERVRTYSYNYTSEEDARGNGWQWDEGVRPPNSTAAFYPITRTKRIIVPPATAKRDVFVDPKAGAGFVKYGELDATQVVCSGVDGWAADNRASGKSGAIYRKIPKHDLYEKSRKLQGHEVPAMLHKVVIRFASCCFNDCVTASGEATTGVLLDVAATRDAVNWTRIDNTTEIDTSDGKTVGMTAFREVELRAKEVSGKWLRLMETGDNIIVLQSLEVVYADPGNPPRSLAQAVRPPPRVDDGFGFVNYVVTADVQEDGWGWGWRAMQHDRNDEPSTEGTGVDALAIRGEMTNFGIQRGKTYESYITTFGQTYSFSSTMCQGVPGWGGHNAHATLMNGGRSALYRKLPAVNFYGKKVKNVFVSFGICQGGDVTDTSAAFKDRVELAFGDSMDAPEGSWTLLKEVHSPGIIGGFKMEDSYNIHPASTVAGKWLRLSTMGRNSVILLHSLQILFEGDFDDYWAVTGDLANRPLLLASTNQQVHHEGAQAFSVEGKLIAEERAHATARTRTSSSSSLERTTSSKKSMASPLHNVMAISAPPTGIKIRDSTKPLIELVPIRDMKKGQSIYADSKMLNETLPSDRFAMQYDPDCLYLRDNRLKPGEEMVGQSAVQTGISVDMGEGAASVNAVTVYLDFYRARQALADDIGQVSSGLLGWDDSSTWQPSPKSSAFSTGEEGADDQDPADDPLTASNIISDEFYRIECGGPNADFGGVTIGTVPIRYYLAFSRSLNALACRPFDEQQWKPFRFQLSSRPNEGTNEYKLFSQLAANMIEEATLKAEEERLSSLGTASYADFVAAKATAKGAAMNHGCYMRSAAPLPANTNDAIACDTDYTDSDGTIAVELDGTAAAGVQLPSRRAFLSFKPTSAAAAYCRPPATLSGGTVTPETDAVVTCTETKATAQAGGDEKGFTFEAFPSVDYKGVVFSREFSFLPEEPSKHVRETATTESDDDLAIQVDVKGTGRGVGSPLVIICPSQSAHDVPRQPGTPSGGRSKQHVTYRSEADLLHDGWNIENISHSKSTTGKHHHITNLPPDTTSGRFVYHPVGHSEEHGHCGAVGWGGFFNATRNLTAENITNQGQGDHYSDYFRREDSNSTEGSIHRLIPMNSGTLGFPLDFVDITFGVCQTDSYSWPFGGVFLETGTPGRGENRTGEAWRRVAWKDWDGNQKSLLVGDPGLVAMRTVRIEARDFISTGPYIRLTETENNILLLRSLEIVFQPEGF
ncbi:unnamed protein product [Amoebophrya sp. A25]|nr:unnamed protein product [Amoebophrya sp. A25]|eukprot:GSA25T00014303001.1